MVHTWILTWHFRRRLRTQQDSPFKLKSETDAIHSACISDMYEKTNKNWQRCKSLVYTIGITDSKDNTTLVYRDTFGLETVLPTPVFTPNQIASIVRKKWQYAFLTLIFIAGETFLYYLVSALFVPGSSLYIKLLVAFFLSLVIMVSFGYGIEQQVVYQRASALKEQGLLTDRQLKEYRLYKGIGTLLLVLASIAIIAGGMSRFLFLETISVDGLSPEKAKSVLRASTFASLFSFFITIMAAIFLAILKKDLATYQDKYSVYRASQRITRIRTRDALKLIYAATDIVLQIERSTELYWQLAIELKRFFLMSSEVDEKYSALDAEYIRLEATEPFILTDAVYRKFSVLQVAHVELFQYGILCTPEIQQRITFCTEILSRQETYIQHLVDNHPRRSSNNSIQQLSPSDLSKN